MKVFLYEFLTAGGLLSQAKETIPASLLAEGRAMITALAADFAAVDGVSLVLLQDHRFPWQVPPGAHGVVVRSPVEHQRAFDRAVSQSDATLLIAPELDDHLLDCCRRVVGLGGRLLGPGPQVVRLAADKQATAERLAGAGVPVPEGRALARGEPPPADFPYPAVLKPRWGAGSQQTHLLPDVPTSPQGVPRLDCPGRIERFCPGQPASVALLCGSNGCFTLPPCRQRLRRGDFIYRGGSLPLGPALAKRATALARRAVTALPAPVGYVGVDLVLGRDPTGRRDVVIEINPRLTTSYVGLRAAAAPGTNLARAMLDVAAGRPPELRFRPVRVEFDPNGSTRETVR